MTKADEPNRVEKYEPYFGLTEAPFSLAPDPRFLFASASFSAALDQLAHALDRREPLVVVTGEIGTGKTLLCRAVLQQFRRKTFLSVIHDPLLERDDLLKQLLEDFGVIAKDRSKLLKTTRHELVEALHGFLRSLGALQAHAVVIIDEAQHLHPDVLEEIRLLSNVDDERGTLLQIILVGQTELEALLARPGLRQLQQRVSRRFWLKPLNPGEVAQYVNHRLALARDGKASAGTPGGPELSSALAEWSGTGTAGSVEFTPAALDAVSELSGGLPRVVNLLCDRSLEEACAARIRVIDALAIRAAARALGVGPQTESEPEAKPKPAPEPEQARETLPAPPTAPAAVSSTPLAPPLAIAPPIAPSTALTTPPLTAPEQESAPEPFWSLMRSELKPAETGAAPAVDTRSSEPEERSEAAAETAAPAVSKYWLVVSALAAAAAVFIWLGIRTALNTSAPPPRTAATPIAPVPRQEPKPSTTTAPAVDSPARTTPAPTAAAAPSPSAPAPAASAAARAAAPTGAAAAPGAAAASDRFDIVVASFRTDERAAAVASEVTTIGLPVRRRVADGWQQVLAGPFASRADAEDAQQKLTRGGLAGTQIVRAAK